VTRVPRSPRAVVVAMFLGSRLLIFASLHAGALLMSPQKHLEWDWVPGKSDLFRGPAPPAVLAPLVRWDAHFYLMIAEHGYPPGHSEAKPNYFSVFFPLYPLAVRALWRCGIDLFWASVAVSNASCLAAALLIFEIGRRRSSATAGVQSAALLLFAPGSHFLSLPYPEGLFCALLAGALLAIVVNRPWVAAGLGALASATRSAGVVVCVALLHQTWVCRREPRAAVRNALAALCSLAGLAAFAIFCSGAGSAASNRWWRRSCSRFRCLPVR
jgi:Gpi18-like mannosyltransferase